MGYEDGGNTYYIVPDMEGSTKIIIDSSQGVVNRLDYDTLGNIRNQTAAPQVELLWRGWFFDEITGLYFSINKIYSPLLEANWAIFKAKSGFIIYTSDTKNPLSFDVLPILRNCWIGTLGNLKKSDKNNNKLCDEESIDLINSLGCRFGWDKKRTLFIIDPAMGSDGNTYCCMAYEIDENWNPTGGCTDWVRCEGMY